MGSEFIRVRLPQKCHLEDFGSTGGWKRDDNPAKKLIGDFKTYEAWEETFKAVGSMRGIGWAILYQDITNRRLVKFRINEHDGGRAAGCNPLFILDAFERASMIDHGLKRADYVAVFFDNVDWAAMEARMK